MVCTRFMFACHGLHATNIRLSCLMFACHGQKGLVPYYGLQNVYDSYLDVVGQILITSSETHTPRFHLFFMMWKRLACIIYKYGILVTDTHLKYNS